jgi:Protein of unknown function (DUF3293)
MADSTESGKYDAYPETVLEFVDSPVARIDLRRPLGRDERATLRRLHLDRPFAILTAENPRGENPEDEPSAREAARREDRNERRTDTLERDLERRGVPWLRVDGVSPDRSYREHCVAVVLPRAEASALARRYDQLALFWFDGDAFWLLPAKAEEAPRRLPERSP